MFLNCGVGEDSWESLGLQGVPSSQYQRKSVLNIHWKHCCWSWNSNTLATWCEELTHLKRPWCWERLKVGRERDDRGWDGWMASPTQWTWVWVSFRSWWWTGKPGMLQSFGLQRVRHNRVNWTEWLQKGHQTHGRQYGIVTLILFGETIHYSSFYFHCYNVDFQLCIFSLDLSCQQQTGNTHSQISALPLSSSVTLANMPWASISCMTHRADVRILMW